MVAAHHRLKGTHMRDMREEWLKRQIEALEEHVKEERRRLQEEKQQQARRALIALSLPELLRAHPGSLDS